jgi:hypothetical protein
MPVIPVDPNRFGSGGGISNNAEIQRRSVSDQVVANTRPAQDDNGDYLKFPDRRGSFSKGLQHDSNTGLVDPGAMNNFVAALGQPRTQVFQAIENIANTDRGAGANTRQWVSPIAGRGFAVSGGDPQQYGSTLIPAAPAFGSPELTFEIAENYWMALLRDVPFSQYPTNALAGAAAAELNTLRTAARADRAANGLADETLAPVEGSSITAKTLFRGVSVGDLNGPYLSQFLCHPVPFGVQGFAQRNKTLVASRDFVTSWDEWVKVQNGERRDFSATDFDPVLRYTRNGRDLAQWVHIDVLFQGYFNACLMMLQGAGTPSSVGGGIGAKRSNANPYSIDRESRRQAGFASLGDPEHISMMCEVAPLALKAVWFQKWYVHLRMRPEAYAGRIDRQRAGVKDFALPAELVNSEAVQRTVAKYGSALLPMAFPEGSPMHPAYGAGHATVAGACVTILKALFKGDEKFPDPVDVVVDTNGQEHLVPYQGPGGVNDLTIEGELNKIASNVALGRNIAGVHWRSDGTYSLRLGEQVAIDLLTAYARSYAEFGTAATVFEFRKFDGTLVTISSQGAMAMAAGS